MIEFSKQLLLDARFQRIDASTFIWTGPFVTVKIEEDTFGGVYVEVWHNKDCGFFATAQVHPKIDVAAFQPILEMSQVISAISGCIDQINKDAKYHGLS